jgi:hypothetical protein
MFDYFEPAQLRACPSCGAPLEWQGKDGPRALFVWREGSAAPVDQVADEDCKLEPDQRDRFRLPSAFEIYAVCAIDGAFTARGTSIDGVWRSTELVAERGRR